MMAAMVPSRRGFVISVLTAIGKLGAAGFIMDAPPALAASPAQLCQSFDRGRVAAPIDGAALRRSTEMIEQRLARRSGSTESANGAMELLNLEEAASGAAELSELAAYCAAAGELMRTGSGGTQSAAQSFLLTAFRMAEAAGEEQVASRAAYRLGLVSLNAATIPATRGARRSRSGTRGAVQTVVQADAIGDGVCGALSGVQLGTTSPQYVASVALRCASVRSLTTQDYQTAALAQLRLARISLALLAKADDRQDYLRSTIASALEQGFAAAASIPGAAMRSEITGRLAEVALESGAADTATLGTRIAAMRSAAGNDAACAAYAAALEARLALAQGDAGTARERINQAIFLEAQRPVPVRLPEWYVLLAEIDPEHRTAHALAGYRALEAIRPLLPAVDPLTEESTFALRMHKVFEKAVDVTLSSIPPGDSREGEVILAAQTMIETFREAEIQSLFGSECVPPRIPFTPSDLAAGEVLLYPVLLADRLEIILAERPASGGPAIYRRLPPDQAADRQRVAALVEKVNLGLSEGFDDAWRPPARELDALLIEPVAALLSPETTLVIIPDGPLRALPFAALPDAAGRFLVERTRLGGSPALAYSQPGSGRRDDQLRVVAASLQQSVEIFGGTFPALEGTTEEARIAAAVGKRSGSRFIEDFRRADLAEALRGGAIDVLHLATHASFNGGSNRSFIVANGEAIPLSELRRMIAGNSVRGGALDLIVLSACETAVGDDEANMGLAGAAIQAGAASAIASLWQVNDAGTAELMRQFYARYDAGQSKAEALRQAQLALLADGAFSDPNIWAAFTLLGAWR